MKVIVCDPYKLAYVKDINVNDIEELKKIIGCEYIEMVHLSKDVGIICDDCGKLNRKEFNRALRDDDGVLYDIIAGTFIIVGLGFADFTGLTDDQLDEYLLRFKYPEEVVVTEFGTLETIKLTDDMLEILDLI